LLLIIAVAMFGASAGVRDAGHIGLDSLVMALPKRAQFWCEFVVYVLTIVFALALLASGQNSTLTGTLAGQIVMEGFLNIRLRPWLRRLITRLIAIIPAIICTAIYGESGTAKLLVFSQVVLSLQLSFAVIPLILFTSDRRKMGEFVAPFWVKILAWLTAGIIVTLNVKYLADFFGVTTLVTKMIGGATGGP
jgi:manganese transport protein